jgi:hypothetical protein
MMEGDLVDGFHVEKASSKPDCEACTACKLAKTPFPSESQTRATRPGQRTFFDVWGKCAVSSIHGNQYFILAVDDYGRYVTVNPMKKKNEANQYVKDYLTYLIAHERMPEAIRIDEGKEFDNKDLKDWCRSKGIVMEFTAPESSSQNGVAERMNRTLVELARTMLKARDLPFFLWDLAVLHAAYLRNRTHTHAVKGKTPYEIWENKRPDVAHLREFGVPVWILHQGQHRGHKLEPRSRQNLFVGFEDGSKAVRYYRRETRKILLSRNYRFLNLADDPPRTELEGIEIDLRPLDSRKGEHCEGEQHVEQTHSEEPTGTKRRADVGDLEGNKERNLRKRPRLDYRRLNEPHRKFPDEEGCEVVLTSAEIVYEAFVDTSLGGDDPKTLAEAKKSPEWPEWEKAVNIELQQLKDMGVWELVDPEDDVIPLANKWVLTRKYNKLGELVKYKARLVVKGCAQRPGFDYTETYAPVVRLETIRAIIALVPEKGLKVQQMDVKGAYLNGIMSEKVCMRQPTGFGDGTGRLCRLIKTIYGLKQAGREWNKVFDQRMRDLGFEPLRSDPCVYLRRSGEDVQIVTTWVDDLLLFTNSDESMGRLKDGMHTKFELTDMGEPSKIVGIEITQDEHSVTISQTKYIESILKREGLENIQSIRTPLDSKMKLEPNPETGDGNRSNSYAQLIGSLMYLATATRPDIAYAVHRLAAFTANPTMAHYGAAKKVLRYLAGTKNHGITYSKKRSQFQGENAFHGYADAGYGTAEGYRSVSGYVFIAGGGAITWCSRKQTTVALSTTEAEYVALSEAAREAVWLRSLYEELGFHQTEPTVILGDNDGSLAMVKDPQFHKRAKHIAIRWHYVREMYKAKMIEVVDVRDPQNTADIFTKALTWDTYSRHVEGLGMKRRSAGGADNQW